MEKKMRKTRLVATCKQVNSEYVHVTVKESGCDVGEVAVIASIIEELEKHEKLLPGVNVALKMNGCSLRIVKEEKPEVQDDNG